MSDEYQKQKHSKRIQQKENHISRQVEIRNCHGFPDERDTHRYHKVSGCTCGNSNCVMCGNPRKFFGEKTIQEKSFEQTNDWQ